MEKVGIATIKDIEAIEKIPFQERISVDNTYEMLRNGANLNPNGVALSFIPSGEHYKNPVQITFQNFIAQVTRTANLFNALGIGSGDVISYLLPNIPQTHYVLWGGEAAGIINPINPMLEASTIRDICLAAGTRVLVALGETRDSDIWQKAMEIKKDLPNLKAVVRVLGPGSESERIIGFDEVLPTYNGESLDSGRVIKPGEIASMYHTGGTTGTPKLAPHTHANEVAMVEMMKTLNLVSTDDCMLCGLPLFHVNGTMVTGGWPLSMGAQVVLLSPAGYRDPSVMRNFFKIVAHYKASFFSCVPTVLSVLQDVPLDGEDISSLKYAICGAAPLSTELLQKFEAHTGMKILEGYGLTEGTTTSSLNPSHGEQKVGSIGLRFPYNEMKVLIHENGQVQEAAPNEIGSICIKGPNVFKGYLKKSQNTNIWMKEGWFNTGDLGRQDADGYFWLTGRAKDTIIRGGHNIDPQTIEEPLYRLEGVQVAAAVGRPDAHAGEVPIAFVQLNQGSKLTEEKIIAYLQNEIGERAAVPKEIFILDEIPLTPVGKIFKPILRWTAVKNVYQKILENLTPLIQTVSVNVGEDKTHGSMASIHLKLAEYAHTSEVESKIHEALAKYTIKYRLIFE